VVAKSKAETTQVSGVQGLPRFVHHPSFADRAVAKQILSGLDDLLGANGPPEGLDEIRLFQAMHYAAYRARKTQRGRRTISALTQKWIDRHQAIRDHLIRVNLGLSYDMLRRTHFDNVDKDDLLGEGLRALCDAVDAYDPWRGFRFSTYACNAIYRGFLRLAKIETRRARFVSFGFETRMERGVGQDAPWKWDERVYSDRLQRLLEVNGAELTGTEQYVLSRRFPDRSDTKRATLESLGAEMKVSKEHVRQVQIAALEKLRDKLTSEPVLC
jgi:RNA polymerase primary sigma factor